tara:strand:- start:315 stop:536 length:222 start_codon:yes stop_codon:yes gene_type:complete
MKTVKVEGRTDLVRDKNSGAIISINRSEVELARERKVRWKAGQAEQQQLKNDVDQLKTDMSDIKYLLTQLVEK